MSELVSSGLELMAFGMGTVFSFLVLLIFATSLMSKIVNKFVPEPVVIPETVIASTQSADPQLLKVLAAAVKEHRARQK
ncbi:MAG: OadG family protein [Oleispira sp.]|nr:OadG family protein [Oleispira sp.]MBL4882580.1 OadG family protein [Oleispira sp.]